jgi:UDP-perosamine 4-acetyltransferase
MPSAQPNGRLAVFGAGGHAKIVIEIAVAAGCSVIGALDPDATGNVLGVPVIGPDDALDSLWQDGAIDGAILGIGNNALRARLADKARAIQCTLPPIVHPSATVSPTATIGDGTTIGAGAIINAAARIGRDCIINTGAIVEHDCVIGDGVHIAPRSVMGGSCTIGDQTLFGIGAVARPGVRLGASVTIGAGAVIVADIAGGITAVGCPARPVKSSRKPR